MSNYKLTILIGRRSDVSLYLADLRRFDPEEFDTSSLIWTHAPLEEGKFPEDLPRELLQRLNEFRTIASNHLTEHKQVAIVPSNSTEVLDLLWGLKIFKEKLSDPTPYVLRMFGYEEHSQAPKWVQELVPWMLELEVEVIRVYPNKPPVDISSLDVGSEDPIVSSWGGLLTIGTHVSDLVASAVTKSVYEKNDQTI